jgi:membrane protein
LAQDLGLSKDAFAFGWDYLRWPVLVLALIAWATTLCHVAPSRRTPWRRDLPGGVLAALLWLLASFGFNLYLRLVVRGNPVFGALGGGLIVMSWLYLLSLSMVLGGEVNALLLRRRIRDREEPVGVT